MAVRAQEEGEGRDERRKKEHGRKTNYAIMLGKRASYFVRKVFAMVVAMFCLSYLLILFRTENYNLVS